METKNIELITKMVIDAINRSESKTNGFCSADWSFRKTHPPDTGACRSIVWTGISAHHEKGADGRTVCFK